MYAYVGEVFLLRKQWGAMVRRPYILGDPQQMGKKSEVATSPLTFFHYVLKPTNKNFFVGSEPPTQKKKLFFLGSRYLVKTSGPSKLLGSTKKFQKFFYYFLLQTRKGNIMQNIPKIRAMWIQVGKHSQ